MRINGLPALPLNYYNIETMELIRNRDLKAVPYCVNDTSLVFKDVGAYQVKAFHPTFAFRGLLDSVHSSDTLVSLQS